MSRDYSRIFLKVIVSLETPCKVHVWISSLIFHCAHLLQFLLFLKTLNWLITNIKLELASFQESQASQFQGFFQGPQVMVTDQHELATLVAEKLYQKVKEDLISSGTGIISQVLNCDTCNFISAY